MLVLSLKPGEQIHIDDDIVVAVKAVNGAQVRLGIEAPKEVVVLREELVAKTAPADSLISGSMTQAQQTKR